MLGPHGMDLVRYKLAIGEIKPEQAHPHSPTCIAPGCGEKSKGLSLCKFHYYRFKAFGSFELPVYTCERCGNPAGTRQGTRFCAACKILNSRDREKARRIADRMKLP